MANIKLVKLVSGLELIGDCTSSSEGVALTKTFQVVVQPVNEQQFSLGMAPLSIAAADAEKGLDVTRGWTDILGVYTPTDALRETYQRMTGTIVVPMLKPVPPRLVP